MASKRQRGHGEYSRDDSMASAEVELVDIYKEFQSHLFEVLSTLKLNINKEKQQTISNWPEASIALTESVYYVGSVSGIDWECLSQHWGFSTMASMFPILTDDEFNKVQKSLRSLGSTADAFAHHFIAKCSTISREWLLEGGWAKVLNLFLTAFPISLVTVDPLIKKRGPFTWQMLFSRGKALDFPLFQLFATMCEWPGVEKAFRPGMDDMRSFYLLQAALRSCILSSDLLLPFGFTPSSSSSSHSPFTDDQPHHDTLTHPKKSKDECLLELRERLGWTEVSCAIHSFNEFEMPRCPEISTAKSLNDRFGGMHSLDMRYNLPRLLACHPMSDCHGGKHLLLLDRKNFENPCINPFSTSSHQQHRCLTKALSGRKDKTTFKEIRPSDPRYCVFELLPKAVDDQPPTTAVANLNPELRPPHHSYSPPNGRSHSTEPQSNTQQPPSVADGFQHPFSQLSLHSSDLPDGSVPSSPSSTPFSPISPFSIEFPFDEFNFDNSEE